MYVLQKLLVLIALPQFCFYQFYVGMDEQLPCLFDSIFASAMRCKQRFYFVKFQLYICRCRKKLHIHSKMIFKPTKVILLGFCCVYRRLINFREFYSTLIVNKLRKLLLSSYNFQTIHFKSS